MSRINLLPEDLRRNDQKDLDRASKRPKNVIIELSSPQAKNAADLKSDKKGPSLWQRLFGVKAKKATVPPSPVAPSFRPAETARPDALARAREEKIAYQQAAGPKKPSWSGVLGPVHSPLGSQKAQPVPQPNKPDNFNAPTVEVSPAWRNAHWGFWWQKQPKAPKPIKAPAVVPVALPRPIAPTRLPPPPKIKYKKPPRLSIWRKLFGVGPKAELKNMPPKSPSIPKPPRSRLKGRMSSFHLAPKAERLQFDINLMPTELTTRKFYSNQWQTLYFVLAVIAPALVVWLVFGGLNLQKTSVQSAIASDREEIKTITARLAQYDQQNQKNLYLSSKMLAIKDLLARHTYWTKFFSLLEKYTLDGVTYTGFAADTSGALVLPARADNYERIAQQLVALKNAPDFVSSVSVDSAKLQTDPKAGIVGVAFELKMQLADKVFKKAVATSTTP